MTFLRKLSFGKFPEVLPWEWAISRGLILNELVTNALKYAFPGSRTGEVLVELDSSDDTVVLRVPDNGAVGLPPRFEWTQSHSLALCIVALLAHHLCVGSETMPEPGRV